MFKRYLKFYIEIWALTGLNLFSEIFIDGINRVCLVRTRQAFQTFKRRGEMSKLNFLWKEAAVFLLRLSSPSPFISSSQALPHLWKWSEDLVIITIWQWVMWMRSGNCSCALMFRSCALPFPSAAFVVDGVFVQAFPLASPFTYM